MTLNERLQALRDKWERLSQRERTMVGALGVAFVVMVTLVVGFFITDGLSTMEEHNQEMRQALRDLDTQRDTYLANRAKSAQMDTRLGQSAVQLSSYVEQASKDAGFEIPDTTPRPNANINKFFTERSLNLHLRAVTLDQLTKFLKIVETRGLVVVTELNVRTRDDKHQQLDVEMTVATYDRQTKPAGKKGE